MGTPSPHPLRESAAERQGEPAGVVLPPAEAFFARLAEGLPAGDTTCLVITHLLPGQVSFLPALTQVSPVAAVLPKPKSINGVLLEQVRSAYRCDVLDRALFADPRWLLSYLEERAAGQSLALLDIGGYFAPALAEVCASFSGRILGVVEDTENGLQRYLRLDKLPVPVYSVARSPLKETEDCLVGEAIVFSTEAILRDLGEVLPGRQACVVGFGKIGAGIARALHGRHVRAVVVDTDPIRQAQAIALGYGQATLTDALRAADLVFLATGSRGLNAGKLLHLRDGAYVASVTSRDDELDLAGTDLLLHREEIAPGVVRYRHPGGFFHMLNDGDAVNFLHSSAIGPSIHLVKAEIIALVKAEIIAALAHLMAEPHDPGLYEVSPQVRASIAAAWMDAFHTPTVTANA